MRAAPIGTDPNRCEARLYPSADFDQWRLDRLENLWLVLLTVSAVLLARSFVNLRRVDPGFNAEGVATLQLSIGRAKYASDQQIAAFCAAIADRVGRLPGVKAAGTVNRLPLGGVAQVSRVQLEKAALDASIVDSRSVSPDYFTALGIPLRAGRFFADSDTAGALPVGIIDDRLARAAWPDQSPLGRRFRIPFGNLPWITIVGVVGHVRHEGMTDDPRPQVYWHHVQRPQDRIALVVRTTLEPAAIARAAIAEIRAFDPDQPVYDVQTMTAVVDRATGQQRLTAVTVGIFAVVALLMSAVGVYGVISYAVRLRAREFGIRMALGAGRRDVVLIVVGRGLVLVGSGLALGIGAAALTTKALTSLLHDVSSTDAASFALAAGALVLAAAVATLLPARRAIESEPMRVLRS